MRNCNIENSMQIKNCKLKIPLQRLPCLFFICFIFSCCFFPRNIFATVTFWPPPGEEDNYTINVYLNGAVYEQDQDEDPNYENKRWHCHSFHREGRYGDYLVIKKVQIEYENMEQYYGMNNNGVFRKITFCKCSQGNVYQSMCGYNRTCDCSYSTTESTYEYLYDNSNEILSNKEGYFTSHIVIAFIEYEVFPDLESAIENPDVITRVKFEYDGIEANSYHVSKVQQHFNFCSDGILNTAEAEQCEDGVACYDGERGWECTGETSAWLGKIESCKCIYHPYCGDGVSSLEDLNAEISYEAEFNYNADGDYITS